MKVRAAVEIEIVDPAWEAAQLLELLRSKPPTTDATWVIFHQTIGQQVNDGDFWELISVCSARFSRLETLIMNVKDRDFEDRQRSRVLEAVRRASRAFGPNALMQNWQGTLSQFLTEDDALHIQWFSHIARRHQPLRRLNNNDREDLIEKVDAALGQIGSWDIPEWAKSPLSDGLRRLRLVLSQIVVFGCDGVIEQILDVYQKASAIEAEMVGNVKATNKPGGSSKSLFEILTIVALAAALFSAADQVTTAFERYKGWYLKMVQDNPRLPQPKQLLIAGPTVPGNQETVESTDMSGPHEEPSQQGLTL